MNHLIAGVAGQYDLSEAQVREALCAALEAGAVSTWGEAQVRVSLQGSGTPSISINGARVHPEQYSRLGVRHTAQVFHQRLVEASKESRSIEEALYGSGIR